MNAASASSTIALCKNVLVARGGTFSCAGHIPPKATAGALGVHAISAKGATSGISAKVNFTLK
jgi:hypothetical protein